MTLLRAAGFRATRSGGSLGVFDLIGISSSSIILVQVKTNRWPSPAEMESIREFPAPSNAIKIVHCWRDYKSAPDVKEV